MMKKPHWTILRGAETPPQTYTDKDDYVILWVVYRGKPIAVKIDKEDVTMVKTRHWWCNGHYILGGGQRITSPIPRVSLHRFIIENGNCQHSKAMCCDHINNDKLDNRRKNLRMVSFSENARNRIDMKREGLV